MDAFKYYVKGLKGVDEVKREKLRSYSTANVRTVGVGLERTDRGVKRDHRKSEEAAEGSKDMTMVETR